jgi:hypothetical protein
LTAKEQGLRMRLMEKKMNITEDFC